MARTAWKLFSANAWWSSFGKKRGNHGKKPGSAVDDDLLAIIYEHGVMLHGFDSDHANEVWLRNITERWTAESKLYLCAVKDVCSGCVVGYSISDRMTSSVAVAALDSAVARRRADGVDVAACIVHTDRGSQSRSRTFVHTISRHCLAGSMARVGVAGENAAMESFFALLQNNVLDRRTCTTRETQRLAIII